MLKDIDFIIFIFFSGPISHISVNPADNSKLLIGFDSGLICLWDLSLKKGEQRYIYTVSLLKSICWHMEGKQFVCSYADGSLCTWIVRPANQASERSERKPTTVFFPHGKKNKDTGKIGMVLPTKTIYEQTYQATHQPTNIQFC